MALTKTAYNLVASTSVVASGTTSSAWVDLTTEKGMSIYATITNGATGPTVPCTCYVEVSNDNGTTSWVWSQLAGDTAANAVRRFRFALPKEIMYARVRFTDHTVQAVTVAAAGASYAE